jgi:hypothetical protein
MESVKSSTEYLGAARGDHGNDSAGQAARLLRSHQSNRRSKVAANNT